MIYRCSACLLLSAWLAVAAAAAPTNPDQKARDEETIKTADLTTDAPALLAFFKKNVVGDVDRGRIKKLVDALGDDAFAVREKANDQLIALGVAARGPLREAVTNPDVEVSIRATRTLEQIERQSGPHVVCAAARLLAERNPAGAADTLLAFAPAAEDQAVLDAVCRSLAVVGFQGGKPQALLTDALTDKLPLRRAVAADALCRGGGVEQRPAVRNLLQDPDAIVRLYTALALFDVHDKEAVPVLITLLVDLPRDQVWRAEDALYLAADDKAPTGSLGGDEVARRDYRKQWDQWWKDNGKDLDLAKLAQQRPLGFTMVMLNDIRVGTGRVQEFDAEGKVRWQIDGLRYPVDAQMIGDDRVLVSEYTARQVTERNLKNEVLWTKGVNNLLLGARRLPNGNTFIVTRNSLTEVDKEGKEVVTINRTTGADIAAGVRLRNGDYAIVTNVGQFVRLNAAGKELKSFPVGQILGMGGNVEVLPNGRVIVPLSNQNKVVEYDADGKQLWEAAVTQPCSVVRLPNGNLLVACRNARTVVEIDRTGKEVWKQTTEGVPLKASRR